MKVLLVYPEFPDTFWSFKHALKFIRKKATSPPLGLLTVAALLPEEWEKRLVDLNVSRLTDADLAWADLMMVSAMTVQRESARQVIQRGREAGVTIVAGGPLFSTEYEQFEAVDHFVLAEAEASLQPFLDDLSQGTLKRVYTSTDYPDITQTPIPSWELVDMKRYATMNIQFSRGCPFNCDFCNITALFGHRPRIKTSRQIIAELDTLYRLGWRETVFFVDDNFIGNKKYLKNDLLPALIEWQKGGKHIPFSTEVSINLADDQTLIEMMVEAGFDAVFVGIETPEEESLMECQKKQNVKRDLVRDVKRIQHAGMLVHGGFIVGFDHDPPSIFQQQIDFIQKSGIASAMVGLLQAPPGTRLYERLKSEGRVREQISGDNVDGTTNIIPVMNAETLRAGYEHILNYIYAPEHYYQRVRTFLKEYQLPKIRARLKFQHVLALFRTFVQLGLLGKERFHYWKLLIWTLVRHTKLFPTAVTLAIYGHHFRLVCEKHALAPPELNLR